MICTDKKKRKYMPNFKCEIIEHNCTFFQKVKGIEPNFME